MAFIDDAFGKDGFLARHKPGYRPRNGQLILARAIDAAIRGSAHLLAEAPTGTGKSMAYLVPAIHHAVFGEKRVVVATANIALQQQIIEKDLPDLAQALPFRFSFEQVKGRSNYLCLEKFEQVAVQGELGLDPVEKAQLEEIVDWGKQTQTGDRAELSFEPSRPLWSRLAIIDDDECKGGDCPLHEPCFVTRARHRASEAQVVVTNQHLLMAHGQLGAGKMLPQFDIAIIDEAHRVADTARAFFGFTLGPVAAERAGQSVVALGGKHEGAGLHREAGIFFGELRRYRLSDAYRARLTEQEPVQWSNLARALRDAEGRLREMIDPKLWPDADDPQHAASLLKALDLATRTRVAAVRNGITRVRSVDRRVGAAMRLEGENRVYHVELDRKDRAALCCTPITVDQPLARQLFGRTPCVIATSATLCVEGGFEYVTREIGVPRPRTLVVQSPFDHRRQALLVTPRDMPDPNAPEFPGAVGRALVRIVTMARGRTLALFTSERGMKAAAEHLAGCKYRVLMQGRDGPRGHLLQEFRKDVSSVLLGLESFWAGVDVPGESLSCVVIDKLPFLPPDDPVVHALNEKSKTTFNEYTLPRAVIALKQGVGRLIRSPADRGVAVLLDPRVHQKRYGRTVLGALPEMRRSDDLDDVGRFLDGG